MSDKSWASSPGVRKSMQANTGRDTKPELASCGRPFMPWVCATSSTGVQSAPCVGPPTLSSRD